MNPQQKQFIQEQEFDNAVRREVVRKLNPPPFDYEPIEQPYCPHWMRQISKSGAILKITWREVLSIGIIGALLITTYVYSNELQEFLKR